MPEFYIKFTGSCKIEAKTEEEAKAKFWESVKDNKPSPEDKYEIEEVVNLDNDDWY